MVTARNSARAYKHVNVVEVRLWNEHIGSVALDRTYGYYAFRYTPEFASKGIEPAPLHMPANPDEIYLFTELPDATYKRLPALLSDALPDDFGNALINRYMADQGIAAANVTPLDRLAYMSTRAMGAMTFRPARGPARHKPTAIVLGDLVEQARKAVTGCVDGDDHANAALRSIIDVGTSAGGARAKAVIALHPQTNEIRSGQLDAPDGFEHWLLKFDGMGLDNELGLSQNYGRIEYAYHLMARAAGIDMSDCRLLKENGRAHFMTKRFDREGQTGRHHMQTLCAMDHVDYKKKGANAYSQLFTVMQQLNLSYEEREEAFRRMVFNVMGRNCDDHTKNFSFLLKDSNKVWSLSPAYDITFAHNPKGEWTHQHLMSINGKFKDFTARDLLAEANRFGIGTAGRVIDQVRAAIVDWTHFADEAELPNDEMTTIQKQHLLLL
ncbi:type II toxin-antitoxin system HipA family toxin [Caballeronia sp. CLC5]|uniref:type II toxin-antitoxin system HipA family toxin n=1 Tax=Caballeronia sp. CLC5 TaxID=2906764 RepID=UPI001F3CE9D9|nr:type II toxin-antitoxin system HipA family toxin [Caballeronia sp. CLC5]MCE4574460.1 type II toxin-antitoxin system HipA family toxin [Caballeronia sp. CLC5]